MPTNYELIRQAIIDKDQVIAMYDGYRREIVIGRKDGVSQALFYQFAGGSSTGLGPDGDPGNWRCMPISQLAQVSVRKGPWHTAGNHSRDQTCVGTIDVEVTL